MFHSSVPFGSQQLPTVQSGGFTLHWVDQLAMQSDELNAEHAVMLQKLNALLRAFNSNDSTRITMACTTMSAAAGAHFAKEEELMLTCGYPECSAHIAQHDELLRRLASIQFRLASGLGFWSPASEQSILERWFVPHLTYADRRFAEFSAARLAAPGAA